MSSNLNRRRIALMVSASPTLEDFINKKLGGNENTTDQFRVKQQPNDSGRGN